MIERIAGRGAVDHASGRFLAGCEYENDLLGNRTLRESSGGEAGYLWDDAGRLVSYTVGGTIPGNPPVQVVPPTHTYVYRSNGMRVLKIDDWGVAYELPEEESGTWDENLPTTRYAYDGQTCALEDFTRYLCGSQLSIDKKRYALGARGIEMIESREVNPSPLLYDPWQTAFPLYDAHGNMIATLSRGSGGTYQVSNLRSFDAWGGVRSGNTQGAPSQRYCASLGHVQDDESSLIYMRARYYEHSTGRFVSEDPARDGANWFVYCGNEPHGKADPTGRNALGWALGAFLAFLIAWAPSSYGASTLTKGAKFIEAVIVGIATGAFNSPALSERTSLAANRAIASLISANGGSITGMPQQARAFCNASAVVGFYTGYGLFLWFAMAELDQWVDEVAQ